MERWSPYDAVKLGNYWRDHNGAAALLPSEFIEVCFAIDFPLTFTKDILVRLINTSTFRRVDRFTFFPILCYHFVRNQFQFPDRTDDKLHFDRNYVLFVNLHTCFLALVKSSNGFEYQRISTKFFHAIRMYLPKHTIAIDFAWIVDHIENGRELPIENPYDISNFPVPAPPIGAISASSSLSQLL